MLGRDRVVKDQVIMNYPTNESVAPQLKRFKDAATMKKKLLEEVSTRLDVNLLGFKLRCGLGMVQSIGIRVSVRSSL